MILLHGIKLISFQNASQGLASFFTNGPPVEKLKHANELIQNRINVIFLSRKQEENKLR
jgi:hypothetical protein